MQLKYIFKFAKLFKKATSGDLRSILKILSETKTFKDRLSICVNNFTKVGTGSGRITFLIDSNTVLKLARNEKGIAQNNAESDGFLHHVPIANSPIDSDPNYYWILTKLAKRINKGSFKFLTGLDFESYCLGLWFWESQNKNKQNFRPINIDKYQEIENNTFFQEVTDLIGNMSLSIGDLCRINSYGEVDGKIKIIDLGLTTSVFEEYYKR